MRDLFSLIDEAQENSFCCSPVLYVMSLQAVAVSAWVQPQVQRLVCRWPILGCGLGATAGKEGQCEDRVCSWGHQDPCGDPLRSLMKCIQNRVPG